jgi:hypothetical protein
MKRQTASSRSRCVRLRVAAPRQKTLQRANERIGQAIELQQQRADQAGDRN